MELESSWHRPHGVLVMSGLGVKRAGEIASPNILDVAPTALALLGLAAGEDFDGRVLAEVLTSAAPTRIASWDAVEGDAGLHPEEMRQDPFEAADALQQLVDLGYMAALPADVQGQLDLVRRESAFNLGVALMSRRKVHEAIPQFERLVAERPAEVRYALCLGNCLLSAARFRDAAASAQTLLNHDANNIEAQMMRATALALAGDESAASTQLATIERSARDKPEWSLALGSMLMLCRRYDDARAHFAAAKQRDPRDPQGHIGLARVELARGVFEPAAEHALDALDISQSLPDAHLLLGAALAWCGDYANARSSLEFALRFGDGQVEAHRWMALVAQLGGDAPLAAHSRERVHALLASVVERPRDAAFGPVEFAAKHGLAAI
jgi:tetratricopeptide (TPR) repeat protein